MSDKDDLAGFRDTFVGPTEYVNRISELILLDIGKLNVEFGVSPLTIFNEIKNLEEGEPPTGVKLATQFKRLPLKGLWHKHFFSGHSLAHNIRLALGKAGRDKFYDELLGRTNPPLGIGGLSISCMGLSQQGTTIRNSPENGGSSSFNMKGKTITSAAMPTACPISLPTIGLWNTACVTSLTCRHG